MSDDSISRQAAIDTLNDSAELLRRVLDDTDIVGAERKKYEWGLGLIESSISDMKDLPSAQPDLDEWCTDCKEYDQERHCCPRWIPVEDKDRLPRDGQRVLVTDEDGEIEIACFIDFSSIDESAEWWSHDYRCHPIAWSELPKPYERSE